VGKKELVEAFFPERKRERKKKKRESLLHAWTNPLARTYFLREKRGKGASRPKTHFHRLQGKEKKKKKGSVPAVAGAVCPSHHISWKKKEKGNSEGFAHPNGGMGEGEKKNQTPHQKQKPKKKKKKKEKKKRKPQKQKKKKEKNQQKKIPQHHRRRKKETTASLLFKNFEAVALSREKTIFGLIPHLHPQRKGVRASRLLQEKSMEIFWEKRGTYLRSLFSYQKKRGHRPRWQVNLLRGDSPITIPALVDKGGKKMNRPRKRKAYTYSRRQDLAVKEKEEQKLPFRKVKEGKKEGVEWAAES